ncbi:MAG: tRNA pseudouridine(55) synthase TruB [Gemmatimonadota bacterium]|nr:tRNA pseudouridine(55) synthase TruB [Gemmatimonadota bacterium]
MTGILLVDKARGPTSHDVVAAVRRALDVRRVGHFGTLDPFATGLLVCGVGPATRLAPFCVGHAKSYRARVRLGWTSTTDDAEGEREPVAGAEPPTREAVEAACARWTGSVDQVPPAYSAKHVEGERAYRRARAGETVALEAETVRIDRIGIVRYEWPEVELAVECGPGTYVRALARDLGEELGTGGYCETLRRTRSGPFEVGEAVGWERVRRADRVEGALLSAESAVMDLPGADLDGPAARRVAHGNPVSVPESIPGDARWVRLRGPRGFIGMAERREGPRGARLQPRKVLYPEGERAWPPGERR